MPENLQTGGDQPKSPRKINFQFILIGLFVVTLLIGGGVAIWLLLNHPSTKLPTQTSTSATSAEKDETANWKTYKNEKIGITFNYPNNWTLVKTWQSDQAGLTVTSYFSYLNLAPQDYNGVLILINITLFENPKDLSAEEYEKKLEKETNIDWDLYNPSDKQLSTELGEDAFYRENGFCEPSPCDIYTLIYHNKGKIVRLSSFKKSPSEGKIPNQKRTFDQILSTFKFLD
ncbi:MAG: hypothetical protein A2Z42_03035 [Candidatus Woykebacteria bacterium RBG_19FT_COMBO_43_10]|uniref:PsbP C-terminal domain-containing protein n=1 Tax=Candidatus Woykebacteria bacterium RBG_19FT_COMBO_43_10 TaxID=1802598 RepID=A0A1G1WIQ3_9BACT|nr:MAG: hypothetical protein A2Z42_03035 [Candidatus Woykebacteria bacterium RBG_19FT_COMBO_43_10]